MRPNPYRDSAWEHAVAITRGWPDASEIPSGRKLNLGSGRICLPNEDGWVNVDIVPSEGVDVRCDLFSFPWPFQDNSVDYMLAVHIVEHVPHQVYSTRCGWQRPLALNGFYAFFNEVYRILRPGGYICVVVPYAYSRGAVMDPQHTRFLLPESFGYLAGQEDDNYDYALPFRFEAINNTPYLMGLPWTGGMTQLQFEQSVQTLWNVVDVMRVDLRPVK